MHKGLFWCTDRSSDPPAFIVIARFRDLDNNEIVNVEGFTSEENERLNHRVEWSKLPKSVTGGKDYNYYPRGRVEIRNQKARIFLNPVLNEERLIGQIKGIFGLDKDPGIQSVKVITDGSKHYKSVTYSI